MGEELESARAEVASKGRELESARGEVASKGNELESAREVSCLSICYIICGYAVCL